VFFSLILALLTAYSYAELARIYPAAGTGSSYYFAEAAFLDKEKPEHQRMARFAKLSIGWVSHSKPPRRALPADGSRQLTRRHTPRG